MAVRITSAVLWFIAGAWACNYLSLMFGLAPIVGLTLATVMSALIGIDPLRLIWPVIKVKAHRGPTTPASVQGQVRSNI